MSTSQSAGGRRLPWHRRFEARVVFSVIVLVALALAAIIAATTQAVTARAMTRISGDLERAHVAFRRVVEDRADVAVAQSALVTALPIFRAHLAAADVVQDAATLEAMAGEYRRQLEGSFVVVGDRDGRWLAAAGWPADAPAPGPIAAAVADATARREPHRAIVAAGGRLFLVVSSPARFADELLGTLTVGYAIDDALASSIAAVTGREVNVLDGGRLYASSLPAAGQAALRAAIADAGWIDDRQPGTLETLGDGRYAVGAFHMAIGEPGSAAPRLLLLEDWTPTATFLQQIRLRLLLTGAATFAVALGMAVVFSRRLGRPLEDLAAAAQDIAAGNWARQLPVRGTAEEAVMARAVNAMTTSLRHWYEEARVRDDQLREAQKVEALGRLAGGIAHDFNNVLTAITGYGGLLLDELGAGDARRPKVEGVLKAADSAASLTRQLLTFSRRRVTTASALALDRVIVTTEKMLRRLIPEDVALRTRLADAAGACALADAGQIEQILVNLVVNARDAMPEGGSVDIELAPAAAPAATADGRAPLPEGEYLRLSVRDTGCGMPPEVQARIFEPFFTTKPEGAGTGLGLAVVSGIVQHLGGALDVESAAGRGTTFHVYLPRTAAPAEEPAEPVRPRGVCPGAGETVLLVEDDPDIAALLGEALQTCGYTVLEAHRGAHALEIVSTSPGRIDLLLTDVVLPDLNGRDLAERVRLFRPHIRVLYMSGYSDEAVTQRGLDTPLVEFIPKPFSVAALSAKIREVLAAPDRAAA